MNVVMPGSGAEDFEIWKKAVSWDSSLEESSRFLVSPVGVYEMCCAFVEEIVSLSLSLSLLMSKNLKLKKVNKSFVPEQISSVFGFLYTLWTLRTLYVYVHYSYTYLDRIFLDPDVDMLHLGKVWTPLSPPN